jgi:hypothetical protein
MDERFRNVGSVCETVNKWIYFFTAPALCLCLYQWAAKAVVMLHLSLIFILQKPSIIGNKQFL